MAILTIQLFSGLTSSAEEVVILVSITWSYNVASLTTSRILSIIFLPKLQSLHETLDERLCLIFAW
ncbi:hypothetical protein THII_0923 [Thioploca ingrica]|uniref:Uncharacterized protein n=1 Tax=Thioploca ingrica TaxID=40754 RepID=A0A090AJT3_9GAMM|nr:hypothetical protein THII_0923 [Thioploca ingrica]